MAFSHRNSKQKDKVALTLTVQKCQYCVLNFKSAKEFSRHLRECHCSREGGSYICKYGPNNLCLSLPIEGVNSQDYEDHILRHHTMSGVSSKANKGVDTRSTNDSETSLIPSTSKPSVVTDQHKWTIFHSSVNLPAVLNDPRLTKRETDFFTKTWGESFEKKDIQPSPHLPEITRDSFRKYLHRTAVRHKKHIKDAADALTQSNDESHKSHIHQLENSRTELEQIPKIFMNANFNLDKLETFNAVFPWSQIENLCDQTKKSRSTKLLQEQLSHFLDVVEVLIAKQIAQKSQAFFHAMTSHDALQEYLITTSQSVKRLRDNVMKIDKTVVTGSLKVLKFSQSRANYVSLHKKLRLMSTVHQTQPTIQLLLSTNEFVGALDLISTTQEVLAQELYGIQCFKHLGSQLAEMENWIEKMIEADFTRYITSDLNRPLTDTDATVHEEKLVAILFGMLRLHKYDFIGTYKEETNSSIKALIKQTVIEAVSEIDGINDNDNVNTYSLTSQMRLLNYEQWMKLLTEVFKNFTLLLHRVKAFCDITTDVVGIAAGRTNRLTPLSSSQHDGNDAWRNVGGEGDASHLHVSVSEDVDVMMSDVDFVKVKNSVRDLLYAVCDYAHDRCVKVLAARAKDGFLERLASSEFVNLSREVEVFVCECERVCGRKSPGLRAALQTQASKFVTRFHNERKNKLSLILDNERWKQADVPLEFQQLVDHISLNGKLALPDKKVDKENKMCDTLVVEGQKFAVVGTALMLLKMIVEYCNCTEDIPSASSNLLTSLIDLLKTFNSRTCQLVLGAGALELVGLKTISVKNLALASRCLQLIVVYIPMVRDHFKKLQTKPNYLLHLEPMHKDYLAHIDEINNKLVAIMEGIMETQLTKWEVKPPVPSTCYRTMCKQISKFHEATADLFPASQLLTIFTRVNTSFKSSLKLRLLRVGVADDGGPQQGLVTADLAFFAGNYRTLSGLESLADQLTDIWDKR